ncbi:iron ABC transporter permease [Streptomyces sp. RB6PN25]|uniref:Iron ABC transporter permease n=1 Tax=Streptomyces humicola TaxID=2953240 RepID=A0ABT1PPE0_9ACTN|nr:iron ABC transporter permease [Streptomyces humicola]MCQ4079541.1 iron ABC transporter permease [Streptomyces humicola]
MDAAVAPVAGASQPSRIRPRRPPAVLLALACAVAAAVLLPVVFLGIEAAHTGWPQVSRVLFRSLTARLLTDTVELALCVTALCAVLGTAAAYTTERTDLPLRRMWSTLIVVPLAIPDFIVGYTWSSIAPSLHGLTGAVLVMTLSLNPLVYLPVAAALRNTDPGLEEAARSLGLGPWAVFRRVTLRQVRPALLGGCLMVCLALLAEYGAFEIMRFQTFTTEIFTQFEVGFSASTACALSIVLVLLALAVLAGQHYANGRARVARASGTRRPPVRHRLGLHAVWVTLGAAALAVLSLGVPVATLGYWLGQPDTTTLPAIASVPSATVTTLLYALLAAAAATVLAVPVALLVERHRSPVAVLLERGTLIVQGLPGMVIAMSLVFFAERFAFGLYQSPVLMIAAYAVLFFPLALVSVRASAAQAPARLEQLGRSLGRRPAAVLLRVTLPLLAPGIAAGFCVVFLSVVTELTATLVLLPAGVRTLATQFWAFQNDESYAAAAPYAAAMVALAVIPGYLLGTWFDRRSSDNRSAV